MRETSKNKSVVEAAADYPSFYEGRVLCAGDTIPRHPDMDTIQILFEPDEGEDRAVCNKHKCKWPCECFRHRWVPVSMVQLEMPVDE